jgi:signal transduction histidine kinase
VSLWQRLVGRRPIVTRLVVAVAAAMAVILLAASAFVFWRVAFALNRQLDQDLDAWRNVVDRAVSVSSEPPTDTPGQTYQLYDLRGRLVGGNEGIRVLADPDQLASARAGAQLRYDVGRFFPPPKTRGYRVQLHRVHTSSGERIVAAAISRSKHDEALRELLIQLAIANLLTLVGASVVGYFTARGALNPVESYRRAAQRAGAERVGRLPVAEDRDDELTRLGHTLNDLLARIEAGAVRERHFLADASHELRSPLALMSTELEWARHRPRTPDEMAEVLASMQTQVARLVDLTDALLEVEELRASGELRRDDVSLAELVSQIAAEAVPDVPVEVQVPDVLLRVNRRWLGIALANLLRNAVRHGGGDITVEGSWQEPRLRLVVHDSGPGFDPEFRDVAFDRFTRADPSRTTPGSGLGLHLVRAVAQAHGGSARVLETDTGAAVELDIVGR